MDHNTDHKASLDQLDDKTQNKPIKPEDRQAINDTLMDQTNMTVMTEQGRSSQRVRQEMKSKGQKVRKPAD